MDKLADLEKKVESSEEKVLQRLALQESAFQTLRHEVLVEITKSRAELDNFNLKISTMDDKVLSHAEKLQQLSEQLAINKTLLTRFSEDMGKLEETNESFKQSISDLNKQFSKFMGIGAVVVFFITTFAVPIVQTFLGMGG